MGVVTVGSIVCICLMKASISCCIFPEEGMVHPEALKCPPPPKWAASSRVLYFPFPLKEILIPSSVSLPRMMSCAVLTSTMRYRA